MTGLGAWLRDGWTMRSCPNWARQTSLCGVQGKNKRQDSSPSWRRVVGRKKGLLWPGEPELFERIGQLSPTTGIAVSVDDTHRS